MFGSPSEAIEPIKTLVLDLPSGVSFVTDPAGGKSALYLIGPLVADVPIEEQAQILPASRSWTYGEPLVYFYFDKPIPPGSYQVVVHQSRIKDTNGDAMVLQDELGNDWTGWALTVLADPRALTEQTSIADPIVLEPGLNPPAVTIGAPNFTVYLDGQVIPPGRSGLSGEVLSVKSSAEAHITMSIEYLTPGMHESLYELYQHRFTTDDGEHLTHFTSVGPLLDYKWAKYHGVRTDGRIMTDDSGKLIVATPVIHEPKAVASVPTLAYNIDAANAPIAGHPNTYDVVTYTVTPSKANSLLSSYESVKFVFPNTINDAADTPETNSRLYPGALYLPETTTITPTSIAAALDLPLAARIRVYADGLEIWWGQTRMIPLMIPTARYHTLNRTRSHSPADDANIDYLIWRASMEVLAFWNCTLPLNSTGAAYVPPTFDEYIMTRLAYGWPYEDGSMGDVTVRMGDHLYSGTPDRALENRLKALANLLGDCQTSAPLFPEDEMYAGVAYIGKTASPAYWAEPSSRPNFWPTTSSRHRVVKLETLTDPHLLTRKYLENAS